MSDHPIPDEEREQIIARLRTLQEEMDAYGDNIDEADIPEATRVRWRDEVRSIRDSLLRHVPA